VQFGHVRQIETVIDNNPDAEPVMPCDAAKSAMVVYGKNVGSTLTVCTDRDCPVHDPATAARLAKEEAENPQPVMEPATQEETEEEAEARQAEYEQRRKEHADEQQRREEERQQQMVREKEEQEAERARREEMRKTRLATFDRILDNAPAMFTAAQLRVFLGALINVDPYDFRDDVAVYFAGDDENNQQSAEEVLSNTIATLPDDGLTRFALRLVLTEHAAIPREGDFDFLAEAEAIFAPPQPKKAGKSRKEKTATPIKAAAKKETAKKKLAA
jgi:ParB family transcriptional regulator, chromosome partitioning protein